MNHRKPAHRRLLLRPIVGSCARVGRPLLAIVFLSTLLSPLAVFKPFAKPADAAAVPPTFVQKAVNYATATATTMTATFGSSNTAGNLIVVGVAWDGNDPFTCSDSRGNSYAIATRYYVPNTLGVGICYASNITAGANTVTVTFSASVGYRRLLVHEYSGIQKYNPLDVTSVNNGNGTAITSNATVASRGNSLAFSVIDADGGLQQ